MMLPSKLYPGNIHLKCNELKVNVTPLVVCLEKINLQMKGVEKKT